MSSIGFCKVEIIGFDFLAEFQPNSKSIMEFFNWQGH